MHHRRDFIRRIGLGLAAVPLLSACGDAAGDDDGVVDAPPTTADAPAAGAWASGGTAAMTDKASYPDPFTAAPTACALIATTTEGPCTTATGLAREDVSEGLTGLPVRLALKIVDASCAPLAGATVKIWHTNLEGSYSGETPNPNMCLTTSAYSAQNFMRGTQVTAADGTAFFDTCFPGWYRGRAVHIHIQVLRGNVSTRVSQLFFPEAITTDIFDTHPEYRSYGQPDTTFATDNILRGIPSADQARMLFDVARMTDGAMLASKVVTVA
ncbi:MAG: protocatechuate 3,4-dioxygenase [Deltaproteobacteria bacterium]|nr:protocatechuate 3,4-dioxygenase [Deltaproteobacteria bacterium]